jgi:uncharacterized phage protein (TIGR02218 family)
MRSTPSALTTHLAGSAHTIATCWLVTRTDGQVFGFTSHDQDLTIDGVVYEAALGINPSTIEGRDDLSVANANASGFLSSEAITDDDLRGGLWDHATVRVFDVNWADTSMGQLKQLRGWLGEFTLVRDAYTTELRGMATAFNKSIGELVGPSCTASVGDDRCKVDMTDYTTTGTVIGVTSNRYFDTDLSTATVRLTPSSTGAPPAGYFNAGLLTWLTGANTNRRMEVKVSSADGHIELQLAMANTVAPGDTFSVSAGCLKSREVCAAQYGNVLNFRGFPDLPGIDKVTRIGGQ